MVTAELTSASSEAQASISGEMSLTYTNTTGAELTEIPFRLYPNSEEYAEGGAEVRAPRVGSRRAATTLSRDATLLSVTLGEPLQAGETVGVGLDFTTTLPTDADQTYGMFKDDSDTNTYSLAHWLPLLAGWDGVHGWSTGPISENGDRVFSEAAVFEVELTVDADLVFVASGSALERSVDGDRATTTHASGPSRDFVMSASADFLVASKVVGETMVNSYFWPGSDMGGEETLRAGAGALALFNDLIGLYPYEELDLVQIDIGNGAVGVEFPGMMFVGSSFYDPNWPEAAAIPGILEFTVVHEVLHQWFYNVVGNNPYRHAFLDESLSNYLSAVYFADRYGAESANEQANLQLRLLYFDMLFNRKQSDQVVNRPTDDFPTMSDYVTVVYGKGALAFMELRHEIGTEAFFAALQRYHADFAFEVARPDDLLAAFEQASGRELDAFWDHWFNEAAGLDDFDDAYLARVMRELGA